MAIASVSTPSATSSTTVPDTQGIDPIRVLRERWLLIALAFAVGGGAGMVASKLRPQHWESEATIILGSVPSDPTQPSGRQMALRSQEEVLAFALSPNTRAMLAGDEAIQDDVDGTPVGAVGIHLHVGGRDRDRVSRLMQLLLARVESDHKTLFDDWQKSAEAIQTRLESFASTRAPAGKAEESDPGYSAMNATRVAALVAAARGPAYSRTTTRVGPPSVYPSPSHRTRDAAAGALAAAAVVWLLAYAFALRRA